MEYSSKYPSLSDHIFFQHSPSTNSYAALPTLPKNTPLYDPKFSGYLAQKWVRYGKIPFALFPGDARFPRDIRYPLQRYQWSYLLN